MSNLIHNYESILRSIPANVKLIAVSKTKPAQDILELYQHGQRFFGENKVQELVTKYETLPKDIHWHMIGHLQSNKIKYIASFISLIHGVESLKLLAAINKEAQKCNRIIHVLLQFHIATEETKFGLSMEEAQQILESEEFKQMKHVSVDGVMGMATYTDDKQIIEAEFSNLKNHFEFLKTHYFSESNNFSELSMGMSGDFDIAIQQGSTMVRVGSSIFGNRIYS